MKKILLLVVTAILLAACGADEKAEEKAEEKSTTKEAQVGTELKNENTVEAEKKSDEKVKAQSQPVTLEKARLVAGHVYNDFKDIWINAEDLYLSFTEDSFSPATHGDRLVERYSAFATDGYLTNEFISGLKQSCHACDMLPMPMDMSRAETIELVNETATSFSLKAYFPLDALSPEANVMQSYVLQDGIWKIDEEQLEVIQPGDGYSYREFEPITASSQFEALYAHAQDTINESNDLHNTFQDLSSADFSYKVAEVKDKLAAVVEQFEETIIPFDSYYETDNQFWTALYEDIIDSTEAFHVGGSAQATIMMEKEIELLVYRIHSLYALYAPYL